MANYYTTFSVLLPEPKDPKIPVGDWLSAKLAEKDAALETDDMDEYDAEWNFEAQIFEGHIWVHTDESGSVEAAACFIQKYLKEFEFPPHLGVFMCWSAFCDKPRINESGGGEVVVTCNDVIWQESVLKDAAEVGVEALNK